MLRGDALSWGRREGALWRDDSVSEPHGHLADHTHLVAFLCLLVRFAADCMKTQDVAVACVILLTLQPRRRSRACADVGDSDQGSSSGHCAGLSSGVPQHVDMEGIRTMNGTSLVEDSLDVDDHHVATGQRASPLQSLGPVWKPRHGLHSPLGVSVGPQLGH